MGLVDRVSIMSFDKFPFFAQPRAQVNIVVEHFSLSIQQKKFFSRKVVHEVPLLYDISASITGGQLVAIMGGSGTSSSFLALVLCK